MELKEYFKILKDNYKIFWITVLVIVVGSFAYFFLRPVSYATSLTLNITRKGSQVTADYKYDDLYRLQADEKFAETIVQWLKSPRVTTDILKDARINTADLSLKGLSKFFSPEKLSSQVVAVSYSSPNPEIAKMISDSVAKIISENADKLNSDQKEEAWFKIEAKEPVIAKNQAVPELIFIFSFLAGIFAAFWAALIYHYIE